MVKIDFSEIKTVHFIGVGGINMSALAKYCIIKGKKVSGSDRVKSEITENLSKSGAEIFYTHDPKNVLGKDLVVYSSAIDEDNPELKYATDMGYTYIKRSEFLGYILDEYPKSVGVSGSHGKTTVTAMITGILVGAGKKPTAFIGGESEFGNFLFGKGDIAVSEICEYKKNMLDVSPEIAVILNIDNDHLDSYSNMQNMVECFNKYINGKISVVCADNDYCNRISGGLSLTYGIHRISNYTAKNIRKNRCGGYSFTLYKYGIKKFRVNLNVCGKFNILNALASICVCDYLGIDGENIKRGLEEFKGVKRRNEYLGEIFGKKVIADYAHHPKEIYETLNAISEKEDVIVFQPHTYSRTKNLLSDFVKVLKEYKNVIIYKTYPARESFDSDGDGFTLYKEISKYSSVLYAENIKDLQKMLAKYDRSKKIFVIGAGDIYFKIKEITDKK